MSERNRFASHALQLRKAYACHGRQLRWKKSWILGGRLQPYQGGVAVRIGEVLYIYIIHPDWVDNDLHHSMQPHLGSICTVSPATEGRFLV